MNGQCCLSCLAPLAMEAPSVELRDRRKGLSGNWCVVPCARCGVHSIVPLPTREEMASFYAAYTEESTISLAPGLGASYPRLRRYFHFFTGDVDPRDFIDIPEGARVLDFGSGQATYLRDLHERGVDIWGAEVTDTLVDACRTAGLKVRKVEDFDSIPFEDRSFDVVYLMQVFEHLRNPHRFMTELARILRRGGALYLAVPNIRSTWRRVFGRNWVSGWFAPFHLAHYHVEAIENLALRHGFRLRRSWSSTPDSWFRLNLRALLQSRNAELDRGRSFCDSLPVRILLTLTLRFCEIFIRERDCLVVHLERC